MTPTQPPARAPEREIDVARLAKETYSQYTGRKGSLLDHAWEIWTASREEFIARTEATLSALTAQGFTIAPAAAPVGEVRPGFWEDLNLLTCFAMQRLQGPGAFNQHFIDAVFRLRQDLAAARTDADAPTSASAAPGATNPD